jgi:hypothetical protein
VKATLLIYISQSQCVVRQKRQALSVSRFWLAADVLGLLLALIKGTVAMSWKMQDVDGRSGMS